MAIYILYAVIAIVVLAIVGTMIKAAFWKTPVPTVEPMPEEKVDFERAQKHLSGAIQIKTISYPDPDDVDWAEFRKFHDYLEKEFPLIHQNLSREVVSRASLLFTWQGKNKDLEPIALLAHQDVVPISEGTHQDWNYEPFSGHNDGEFIWGRGAIDMKNHLICVMEAVETLLEEGYQPERTVYLCFGHNEEVVAGTENGAQALMQTLKERGVRLDSTLDEGGAMIPVNVKGVIEGNLTGVGVAEKGYADYKITIKAKGGHSSQPPNHTAAGRIANVVEDLEKNQFKARILPSVYELFDIVGKRCTYPVRLLMCNNRLLAPILKKVMTMIPFSAVFVRTTTACTMLSGSPAANVLPQNASVTVNFRELPGTSLADTEAHIRKVCRNKDIEVEFLKGKEPSKISPTNSRAFKTIEKLALQIDNKNIVAPYLVMGGTDSYHYEEICENIYRFAPFNLSLDLLTTTHGTNERLPIEQLIRGVTFFKRYIREMSKD